MNSPRRPVLLTGATGFIGRHLTRHLLDLGHPVHALVRPASAARAQLDPRCRVIVAELADRPALAAALTEVGHVVYGAGAVRGGAAADFQAANVAGVRHLVEALGATPQAPPLVLISSLVASRPALSDYALSKHDGEAVLHAAPALCWSILRPPAVYGPGDTELQPLFELIRRGIALRPGPPGQRLALLHVDDLVRAIGAALLAPEACRGATYAIDDGRSQGYSWAEIAAAITRRRVREVAVPGALLGAAGRINRLAARVFGYLPMLTPGKARELQQATWLCDNSPFTLATGWQPEIDLEQGAAALFR